MNKPLRYKLNIFLFLLPALILFICVLIAPIIMSLAYSFTEWNGFTTPEFIGIKNYIELFTSRSINIGRALKNALLLALLSCIIQLPFALWLALRLARPIKGRTALLSIFFMPVLISTVVIGQLWLKIYNPDYGVLNVFLRSVGLDKWTNIWLGNKKTALGAAFVPILWQYVGYHMLLMYAGIRGVPVELSEAAMLDGCTPAQVSRYIIIPYIRPILRVSVIFAITGSLKSFDLIYVLTNGGPSHTTEVPSTLMINLLFLRNRYGMGSTIAVMLIILCFFFALVINALFKEEK
ncbi:MAG: sugar ABC transporter permease [Oscillospiraceae bacterium]|nr:sugar ABC transporter permease [Oscillospiraceae bacterium]MBP5169906.1 sugar ABC transporter permease [Oscillospiraceae bacterium]